jgi:RimJ/RimL family protein N-acetyltransferase
MIVEATGEDYSSLLLGRAPGNYSLADTPIAPPEVIRMLGDLAAKISAGFSPASWLIVEDGEVVGLCSITRPPENGTIDIGYGIAPSRQKRGIAARAIREVVIWARESSQVSALTAETGIANIASQQVLSRNGFLRVGERVDDEDGPLICWRCPTD